MEEQQLIDELRFNAAALKDTAAIMESSANEIERLRAENERLRDDLAKSQECCARRGARMQKMLDWFIDRDPEFVETTKEFREWFDENGAPK